MPPNDKGIRTRRGNGGPSTAEGKAKTKFNATTHGIFSSVVVLKGETRTDYEWLLNGLWRDCQPQGLLEEILVEKLAMILWRHRRSLISENGEILKSHQCLIWDEGKQLQDAVAKIKFSSKVENGKGLSWEVSNLEGLDRCLKLLATLRKGIEDEELRAERDFAILNTVYGTPQGIGEDKTLLDSYTKLELSEVPEDIVRKKLLPPPEACRDGMLWGIDVEIERLKKIRQDYAAIQVERTRFEMLRRRIPDGPELERLLHGPIPWLWSRCSLRLRRHKPRHRTLEQ